MVPSVVSPCKVWAVHHRVMTHLWNLEQSSRCSSFRLRVDHVSHVYPSFVLFKPPGWIITRCCVLKHDSVVNIFHPTARSPLRCHVCLEPLSLENCSAVQTSRLCETGFSCYTLEAFETILNTYIFAKGCIPEMFCSGNRGCEILNQSRNGTIDSCSFNCCHTEQCNAGSSVSLTPSPLPTTTEEPTIQPTAVPTTLPGKISLNNAILTDYS